MSTTCLLLMACLTATIGAAVPHKRTIVLKPDGLRQYVKGFNDQDGDADKVQNLTIPNAQATDFLEANVPLFDCPDKQMEETYYFRWWSFRKHLVQTPDGWVITEFLPKVPWAGVHNTISCAAGHHLYEARWLGDPQYADDYARFWCLPEAQPRNYSFWAADAVRAVTLATGNDQLARDLLPNLAANFHAWERTNRDESGLFRQVDDRDGMEYSLGGSGYRPSINAYMYGDAAAISDMARRLGSKPMAEEFGGKAASLKSLVQDRLWSRANNFFETLDPKRGLCGVREQIGFIPWYFNLPNPGHESAWSSILDPQGFSAPYGPTTVERRAVGFMHPENHDCLWNGPSWPYATTQTLVAMANLLDNYSQTTVSKQDYFKLLQTYSQSQRKDGHPWIAEDLDADSGNWIVDLPRSVDYNHSGFADLVITGLVGLRPRSDNRLVIKPLVSPEEWPWFCLDGVSYHGHSLTILWDQDGKHYSKGQGLTLFLDGKKLGNRTSLGNLEAALKSPVAPPMNLQQAWQKYPEPVLGGKLGTCFDICALEDDGKYKMFFSWRPRQSIAVVESEDGIHWSEPQIVLGPTNTGWEDDINRPSVVKHGGLYHIWYTGQYSGRSSIGYATSSDGVHWKRELKPVLEPQQSWEKVAVMCPTVTWDDSNHEFRMWYSGGEQYEPDAIGYAISQDGVRWLKHDGPVFEADPNSRWERFKVTACQVVPMNGWQYMFYIGFRDIDHAQIGIARSIDGISHWERLKANPIISPTVDGWDADACYKPFAVFDQAHDRWLLWYNGRHGGFEQIGVAIKHGTNLGF